VGVAFDRLVAQGGTALFGETTEIIGAEELIAGRCASPEVAERLLGAVAAVERRAVGTGLDIRGINPMASNIAGGISTLEEKCLGAVKKAGSAPVQGVLEYAEQAPRDRPGLYFVDNGPHAASIQLGYAAAGAVTLGELDLAFVAHDVPGLGYATYTLEPAGRERAGLVGGAWAGAGHRGRARARAGGRATSCA
jgi:hypothetical protein